jgi:hypothetical protein
MPVVADGTTPIVNPMCSLVRWIARGWGTWDRVAASKTLILHPRVFRVYIPPPPTPSPLSLAIADGFRDYFTED